MHRAGCADIDKALPPADACGGAGGGDGEDRHLLTGMVGAGPARVAAVIGGYHEQVVAPKRGQQFRQPRVERFEGGGVAWNVSAVTVKGIEVDEIGDEKPAIVEAAGALKHGIEERVVAVALQNLAGA